MIVKQLNKTFVAWVSLNLTGKVFTKISRYENINQSLHFLLLSQSTWYQKATT